MNVTIFGATGATGKIAIKKALEKGYRVTAYVRNRSKMDIVHQRLRVIEGDLSNERAIEQALEKADAVLSFLGPKGKVTDNTLSDGVGHIVRLMEKQQVKRLVALGTRNIEVKEDGPDFRFWLMVNLLKLVARGTYQEVINMGLHIQQSTLDWTIVRIPWLTNKPATRKLNVGYFGENQSLTLSREDMAHFFIDQISDRHYIQKAPALSNV
ncbi:NAD(P)H-binding protein [Spirosoma knui]